MEKETEKILVDILAASHTLDTAREVRHIIKDYLLLGVVEQGGKKVCLACNTLWDAPVWFCPNEVCKNSH